MVRTARIVIPNIAHHVTQRGNDCQTIFFEDLHRLRYLSFLRKSAEMYGVRILAYCLMTNHVHLIAIPSTEESLAKAVGRTHLSYAKYMQHIQGRSGHFWQGRFYSCPLDEAHAHNAAAYVELNPVRAGIVTTAWEYPWSSAIVHAAGEQDVSGLLDMKYWSETMTIPQWRATLEAVMHTENIVKNIRESTRTGHPLGDKEFLKEIETQMTRSLPVPRGRPPKR